MKSLLKRQSNEAIRNFLLANPRSTHEQIVKELRVDHFTKAHFFTMRSRLRKAGLISADSGKVIRQKLGKPAPSSRMPEAEARPRPLMTVEILESIDASGFSDSLKEHYKSHFLPLLRTLLPDGKAIHFAFISDPPAVEIRRIIS